MQAMTVRTNARLIGRGWRSAVAGAALAVSLAGCGGSDGGEGAAPELADATTTSEAIIEGDGDTTSAPTTEPATTVATTVVVTAPVETTPPPTASPADCLQGRWIANEARMQAFVGQLISTIPVTIDPGSSYDLQIDGTFFSSVNTVNASFTIPGGPQASGSATGLVSGVLNVDGDRLTTTVESTSGDVFEGTAVVDGVEFPIPASSFDSSALTFDVNNTTFVCDGTTLVLTVPTGPATVTFDRA
jgi:hypothetical protein